MDYEEDIYLGYKWYETYWAEASAGNATPTINGASASWNNKTGADAWYDYNVVYPYGYGLSYTDFSYTLNSLKVDNTENDLANGYSFTGTNGGIYGSKNPGGAKTITASVKVTNTGDVAGKETVEIYVEAPYTSGAIEKPYYTLVGFAKTGILGPGDEETVTITFNIQDFASFDYSGANDNGSNVYELDPGQYTVHVMGSSSHENISTATDTDHNDAYESATFTIDGGSGTAVIMDLDDYSGNEVEAVFSDPTDDYYSNAAGAVAGTMYTPLDEDGTITSTLLSRADFDAVRPTAPTSEIGGKTVAGGLLDSSYCGYSVDDSTGEASHSSKLEAIREWWMSDMYMYADTNTSIDSGAVWEKTAADIPEGWTQGTGVAGENGMYATTLNDMVGKAMYDENGKITSEWDEFMNRFARKEILLSFCGPGV